MEKYMTYSGIESIPFPWTYEQLIDLPLYMIETIYKKMDERIERERKRRERFNR